MTQKMKQTVAADRALKSKEVQEMTGLSRSTIHRMESKSLFPRRFRIGLGRRVAWSFLEIQDFLASRPRVELKG